MQSGMSTERGGIGDNSGLESGLEMVHVGIENIMVHVCKERINFANDASLSKIRHEAQSEVLPHYPVLPWINLRKHKARCKTNTSRRT